MAVRMRWAAVGTLLWCGLFLLARTLNPNDPNVCSSWESYSITKPEMYLTPQDEVQEEECDDPRSDYRCTRHKITYRQTYRPGVQTDYRKRSHCCRGYYESRGVCVAQCSEECVHGRCAGPERCQCASGWRGSDCSSACPPDTWGKNCSGRCPCRNGSYCDPRTGHCSCSPGYRGLTCEDPCPPGTYGEGCLERCRCRSSSQCDHKSGRCQCMNGTTGALCERECGDGNCGLHCPCQNGGVCTGGGACHCPPGWTGSVCAQRCPQGRFGQDCSRVCGCHHDGQCHPVTGQCRCTPGYTGDRCQEDCPPGRYGLNCAKTCDCLNQAGCRPLDGVCLCGPGFQGNRCGHRLCHDQLYGHECKMECRCDPEHSQSCHPITGVCTCLPGWSGLHCTERCPPTFYGTGCLNPCLCLNGGSCDPVTGQCTCAAGYMGKHCSEVCPPQTYGLGCLLKCQCDHSDFCSPIAGSCHCLAGWTGRDCSTPCAPGRWGPGCNYSCRCSNSAVCNPADGECECGAGWHGADCEVPCPDDWFGPGCTRRCNCDGAKSCDPISGLCHCPAGWSGPHCDLACDPGHWGPDCALTCRCWNGGQCHWENGSCLCPPGYSGPSCQHHLPDTGSTRIAPAPPADGVSLGAIIGIVAVLAVVVFLLALFVCLRLKYGGKSTSVPSVSYTSAVGTGSGEYVVPDVPQSYIHYYANPSYNTLSRCGTCPPPLPQLPNNLDQLSTSKTTDHQLFRSKKNVELERPVPVQDCNATLPADWKHSPKHKDLGVGGMDRSYSYSNSLPKYCNTGLVEPAASCEGSVSSSENVYATIQDLPSLTESSYVEMTTPSGQEGSYTEIGHYPERGKEQHASGGVGDGELEGSRARPRGDGGGELEGSRARPGGVGGGELQGSRAPSGNYDSPRNSRVPGHYDQPPSRHRGPLHRR